MRARLGTPASESRSQASRTAVSRAGAQVSSTVCMASRYAPAPAVRPPGFTAAAATAGAAPLSG
ncbi:hypothetical protein KNE206_62260 [Kitasatospora sp. NE20-6]